ncbi:quinone-interacting membrane-bound oxidoreductase complex subunit QmoC [Thermodesulfobacteriota bacterium]
MSLQINLACMISPDTKPFPRKEMIAASWGLKDRLIADHDIWLCHNCGDCTTLCPRGAKPGDVLGAIRAYTVADYAVPKALGRAVNDPKKLPFLLAIPVVIFLVLGLITGLLDFTPEGDEIVQAHFVSTWLVDMIMIPTFFWAVVVFGLGLKRFLYDIHENAILAGKTEKKELDPAGLALGLLRVVPTILAHRKFNECGENNDRSTAHLLVLYAFIGLFIVTNIFFVALYVLGQPGPYSQLNPVKWLANIAGVALVVGGILLIKKRLDKKDQLSSYKDWYLLGLVLALGLTGLGTETTRLAGLGAVSYALYFIHLMFIFCLFAYTPFSKLAHIVYRTVALTYDAYINRV